MSSTLPEPHYGILMTSVVAIVILLAFYFFGVWSRNVVFPANRNIGLRAQLIGAIPVGFIVVAGYAKTALPPLLQLPDQVVFDGFTMVGYMIILGMLSREALEKIIRTAAPTVGVTPKIAQTSSTVAEGKKNTRKPRG